MAFWTETGQKDPKRQYRFVAKFGGLGASGCSWFVKSIDKPSVSLSEASHEYLNHTFYYPGRVTWNSVSCTLVDPLEPDAAATMMKAIEMSGYKPPKDANALGTASKSNSVAALGTVTISQLDGDGNDKTPIEQWKLHNAWIKSVNLSGLDYSGDSLSDVTIEIRYDWASLESHGVTENVGGALTVNQGLWKLGTT
jgi:hypothetical protein